ncbi:PREDICTED: basic salivary proline-rich protein 2-like [Ceratotherium simum simum]|uniref:Basic salivary proline-rich protein 2-like n=1 Tax=Ceratotherium simum simum TaxID=73337 RepID=A0ABM1DI28_CERSS|nr:PREDICTED: basic salivary proline-rich protein 2-like [Ceratotherium simum simum]
MGRPGGGSGPFSRHGHLVGTRPGSPSGPISRGEKSPSNTEGRSRPCPQPRAGEKGKGGHGENTAVGGGPLPGPGSGAEEPSMKGSHRPEKTRPPSPPLTHLPSRELPSPPPVTLWRTHLLGARRSQAASPSRPPPRQVEAEGPPAHPPWRPPRAVHGGRTKAGDRRDSPAHQSPGSLHTQLRPHGGRPSLLGGRLRARPPAPGTAGGPWCVGRAGTSLSPQIGRPKPRRPSSRPQELPQFPLSVASLPLCPPEQACACPSTPGPAARHSPPAPLHGEDTGAPGSRAAHLGSPPGFGDPQI